MLLGKCSLGGARAQAGGASWRKSGSSPSSPSSPRTSKKKTGIETECTKEVVLSRRVGFTEGGEKGREAYCQRLQERDRRSRRNFFGFVGASTVAMTLAPSGRSLAEGEVGEEGVEGLKAVVVEPEEGGTQLIEVPGDGSAATSPPSPPTPSPSASTPSAVTVVGDDEKDSIILLTTADIEALNEVDKKALKLNRQIQSQNRAPKDFPEFVRRGFDMLIFADGYKQLESGLIVKDLEEGQGNTGNDGDEMTFHYSGFNEEGGFIDSSYKKGRPAQIRLGIGGMIPGFELALRDMKPGSRRIVIIPPALGPPVGPSTFFSAKQYEIFDINLLGIKTCVRSSFGLVSTVKCE